MKNRRKSPRFEYFLELKYTPRDKPVSSSYTILKNISLGGLCMPVLSRFAGKGDSIRLDIKPRGGKEPVTAIGEVRWVKKISRPAQLDVEVGVQFVEIDPEDLKKIIPPAE